MRGLAPRRPRRRGRCEREADVLTLIYRAAVNVVSAGFSLTVLGFAAGALALGYVLRELPDYQKLAAYEPPIVSRVYAGDGTLIGEFASEKRIFVPYELIPKRVVNAFVAAEDQRFFSHPGIDAHGVVRALRDHFVYGARLTGASTITQQVAKTFFLSPERSYGRKLRELVLATRMEQAYSKEKILELYLNQIFLGRQSYGVAAAALAYFDKSLEDLTVGEAALLAALPQAPSRLNPARNRAAALHRRNYVIGRMQEDGYITAAEAEEAKAAPIALRLPPPNASVGHEYFVEEVRRELLAKYGEEKMRAGGFVVRSTLDPELQKHADAVLRRGLMAYDRRHGWRGPVANLKRGSDWAAGWRKALRAVAPPDGAGEWPLAVVLEVDAARAEIGLVDGGRGRLPLEELKWARKQGTVRTEPGKPAFRTAVGPPVRRASDVLEEGDVILVERVAGNAGGDTYSLRQVPEVTGALVAMDPHTGRVLAMSGGFSFGMRQFNNATQAWRQPGSSFKPYVYLAALQERFTPSTVINDAPIALMDGRKLWTPRNYANKFYGPVTMRQAIEYSLNLATLRLAQATGLKRVAEIATKLGVSDNLMAVPSLPLGAFETTPLRQVTAYSMIVNGGERITPTLVDRIQDRHGRTIYRHDESACPRCAGVAYSGQSMPRPTQKRERVLDEDNAYQIVSLLEGAAKRSPAVAALKRPVAGKTGTTNDGMDAWFVGFTPDLAVAVWLGFDQPRSLGKDETGTMAASPIFADFMATVLKDAPARNFARPKGVVAVNLGSAVEYYKKGTEPGTGNGRQLDAYVASKPPDTPDDEASDYGQDGYPPSYPPPGYGGPGHGHGYATPDYGRPRHATPGYGAPGAGQYMYQPPSLRPPAYDSYRSYRYGDMGNGMRSTY
jgi:penicillin-binding protein 1A